MQTEYFTLSRVRLRRRNETSQPDSRNWLLLPGGPGIGSESLVELADLLDGLGNIWLVDLPGDGSNEVDGDVDPYENWPAVLLEAAEAIPGAIFVGHSTGGMYLLSVPDLERHISGMVLISSAPNASWFPAFVEMTQRHPLPAVDTASEAFEIDRTNERLRDVAVASAEWNFTPAALDVGRDLLSRMPYNYKAVDWSDKNFDHTYQAQWWPSTLPVLILSGAEDQIVDQSLWNDDRFAAPNVTRVTIPGTGHFPWIDRPKAVKSAIFDFASVFG